MKVRQWKGRRVEDDWCTQYTQSSESHELIFTTHTHICLFIVLLLLILLPIVLENADRQTHRTFNHWGRDGEILPHDQRNHSSIYPFPLILPFWATSRCSNALSRNAGVNMIRMPGRRKEAARMRRLTQSTWRVVRERKRMKRREKKNEERVLMHPTDTCVCVWTRVSERNPWCKHSTREGECVREKVRERQERMHECAYIIVIDVSRCQRL